MPIQTPDSADADLINAKLLRFAKQALYAPTNILCINLDIITVNAIAAHFPTAKCQHFMALPEAAITDQSIDLIIANLSTWHVKACEVFIPQTYDMLSLQGLFLFATFDHASLQNNELQTYCHDEQALKILQDVKLWHYTSFKELVYRHIETQRVIDCDIFFVSKDKILRLINRILRINIDINSEEDAFSGKNPANDRAKENKKEPKFEDEEDDAEGEDAEKEDEHESLEVEKEQTEAIDGENEKAQDTAEIEKQECETEDEGSVELDEVEQPEHREINESESESETNAIDDIESKDEDIPEPEEAESLEIAGNEPPEAEDDVEDEDKEVENESAEKTSAPHSLHLPDIEHTAQHATSHDLVAHHNKLIEHAEKIDTHRHDSADILKSLTIKKLDQTETKQKMAELKLYRLQHQTLLNEYQALLNNHKDLVKNFIVSQQQILTSQEKLDNYHQLITQHQKALAEHEKNAREHQDFLLD